MCQHVSIFVASDCQSDAMIAFILLASAGCGVDLGRLNRRKDFFICPQSEPFLEWNIERPLRKDESFHLLQVCQRSLIDALECQTTAMLISTQPIAIRGCRVDLGRFRFSAILVRSHSRCPESKP